MSLNTKYIMGAPVGNKNAVGNKGGGRRSAYQERQDAERLKEIWTGDFNKTELMKKLQSGEYSPEFIWIVKAIQGNMVALKEMFKKIYPDNINLIGSIEQKSMQQMENDIRELVEIAKGIDGRTYAQKKQGVEEKSEAEEILSELDGEKKVKAKKKKPKVKVKKKVKVKVKKKKNEKSKNSKG